MNIGLDFDDTYTADPVLWDAFISNAQARGHTVYCTTYRFEDEGEEVKDSIGKFLKPNELVFTGRKAKREFCERLEIYIDVWIDDCPEYILRGMYQ